MRAVSPRLWRVVCATRLSSFSIDAILVVLSCWTRGATRAGCTSCPGRQSCLLRPTTSINKALSLATKIGQNPVDEAAASVLIRQGWWHILAAPPSGSPYFAAATQARMATGQASTSVAHRAAWRTALAVEIGALVAAGAAQPRGRALGGRFGVASAYTGGRSVCGGMLHRPAPGFCLCCSAPAAVCRCEESKVPAMPSAWGWNTDSSPIWLQVRVFVSMPRLQLRPPSGARLLHQARCATHCQTQCDYDGGGCAT